MVDRKILSSLVYRSRVRFFSDLCAVVGLLAPAGCGLGRPAVSVYSGSSTSGSHAAGDFSGHRRLAGFLPVISFLFLLRRSAHF